MKECIHCGKQLRDETTTCKFCGKPADTIPEPEKSESTKFWEKYRDIVIVLIIIIVMFFYYVVKK